jgi:hypothetical protein
MMTADMSLQGECKDTVPPALASASGPGVTTSAGSCRLVVAAPLLLWHLGNDAPAQPHVWLHALHIVLAVGTEKAWGEEGALVQWAPTTPSRLWVTKVVFHCSSQRCLDTNGDPEYTSASSAPAVYVAGARLFLKSSTVANMLSLRRCFYIYVSSLNTCLRLRAQRVHWYPL